MVRAANETRGAPNNRQRSLLMANDPTKNHGEGNPEAASRFNDAETRFVESARGKAKVQGRANVRPDEQSELDEAERLGKARAKGDAPVAGVEVLRKP
jgi:hypothetical protein